MPLDLPALLSLPQPHRAQHWKRLNTQMSTNANSPHNLDLLLNAISENEPSTDSSSSSSPNMHAIQSLLAASQQLASPTTAQPQDIPQQGPPPDEDEDEEPPSASSTAHENGDDEMVSLRLALHFHVILTDITK
jgi:hypothetical protein